MFKKILSARGMGQVLSVFAALIVMIIVFALINPLFFSATNITNLLRQVAPILIIGVGQSFVLITAGIDLSIGSVAGMSCMISATLMTKFNMNPILTVLITIICCLAIGLVNDGYTNSDPANETRYDLQDMFGAGKVAMMIGPNNIPTYLSDGGYDINYDVTTIPANEGCDSVAMGVCDRLEVFKDDSAEDQEARTAAISKFFDFFYDDERYADYMVFEGFLPTTQTAADLLAKDDDTFASWIDILQSCNFYPATKTEWADVKQGVIEVEQNALLGDDVQTLLDDLQADIAG